MSTSFFSFFIADPEWSLCDCRYDEPVKFHNPAKTDTFERRLQTRVDAKKEKKAAKDKAEQSQMQKSGKMMPFSFVMRRTGVSLRVTKAARTSISRSLRSRDTRGSGRDSVRVTSWGSVRSSTHGGPAVSQGAAGSTHGQGRRPSVVSQRQIQLDKLSLIEQTMCKIASVIYVSAAPSI